MSPVVGTTSSARFLVEKLLRIAEASEVLKAMRELYELDSQPELAEAIRYAEDKCREIEQG